MKIRMQQYQDIESFKIDLLTFWNDYVRSESDNLKLQQSTALFGAAIQRLDSVTQTSTLSLHAVASQPKSLSVLLGAATTSLLQFSKGKDAVHYHLNCVEAGAIRHAEAIAAARRHLGGSFVYSSPTPVSGPSSMQGSCSDTLLSESLDPEAAPGAASYQTPSASSAAAAAAAAAAAVAEKPQKPRPRSSRRAVVAGAVSASVSVSGGGIEASGTAVIAPAAVVTPNVVVVSSSSSQTLVEANSVQKRHLNAGASIPAGRRHCSRLEGSTGSTCSTSTTGSQQPPVTLQLGQPAIREVPVAEVPVEVSLDASRLKGVVSVKQGSYRAEVCIKGRLIILGQFDSAIEASRAHDCALIRAIGPENCRQRDLNFPISEYASFSLESLGRFDRSLVQGLCGCDWTGVKQCDFSFLLLR